MPSNRYRVRPLIALLLAPLWVLVSGGCGEARQDPTDFVLEGSCEFVRHAGIADEDERTMIMGNLVAMDRRGHVFVGDRFTHTISVFGRDGERLRTFGGQGQGPGEFERLDEISVGTSDSLYAFDFARRMMLVFAPFPSLEYARMVRLPFDSTGWVPRVLPTAGGFYAIYQPYETSADRRLAYTDPALRTRVDSVLVYHPPELVHQRFHDHEILLPVPFGRAQLIGIARDGTLYTSWNDSISIDIIDTLGIRRGRIRLPYGPDPVTAAERDSVLSRIATGRFTDSRALLLESVDIPATHPAAYDLISVSESILLIAVRSASIHRPQWWALDLSGRRYSVCELPAGKHVLSAVDSMSLVYESTEDGMGRLWTYDIRIDV